VLRYAEQHDDPGFDGEFLLQLPLHGVLDGLAEASPAGSSPLFIRTALVFASLLHGPHEVLHVPARVALGPLVQLAGPPLGLLAGREAPDLLFEDAASGEIRVAASSAGTAS
jgi:hypothetical protein